MSLAQMCSFLFTWWRRRSVLSPHPVTDVGILVAVRVEQWDNVPVDGQEVLVLWVKPVPGIGERSN